MVNITLALTRSLKQNDKSNFSCKGFDHYLNDGIYFKEKEEL